MSDKFFPDSRIPVRKTVDLLPQVFKTESNEKFLGGVLDPLIQPGVLQKNVGYIGKRFGKTYNSKDIYLDSDATLRSRYQLEPAVVLKNNDKAEKFYDYIDFKNQIKFFKNNSERDDLVTSQEHYSWNPPIKWDQFVNFREYYWVPNGPPAVNVLGTEGAVTSTYKVRSGIGLTWIFTPDGQSNNPTITLYRGYTYNFEVSAVDEAFVIRSSYDTGSLNYNPILPYVPKQLAVYDGKLWQAKNFIPGAVDNTIVEGPDWEIVDYQVVPSRLDYNNGVVNNGVVDGTLTFTVPLDAPDVLFYQSSIFPDRFGRFIIEGIESNTSIDIEKEILGKQTYTSSNKIEFKNGLMVTFGGRVTPEKYSKGQWVVENVGQEISLINFADLEVPVITNNIPDVLFDDGGFDIQPYDDATAFPADKDYITICRSNLDNNPWSRYNRWFHKETLEYAHAINKTDFDSPDTFRAKRPIIEFKSNIQLFNHGSVSKQPVDFIDDFTTDVFSTIEGSQGYSVDGIELFNGARLLVTADTDSLANNKIYRVEFIIHNFRRQIALRQVEDSEPILGEGVLVKRGNRNRGLMYHYNGTAWVKSQEKTSVNQSPLFDLFDSDGISFSDNQKYPVSSFIGTTIINYKESNSVNDSELGFPISYLNIDNVGDTLFEFDLDKNSFVYSFGDTSITLPFNRGFYRFNPTDTFENGWRLTNKKYLQPILDSVIIEQDTDTITIETVEWDDLERTSDYEILFFINGNKVDITYERINYTFKFNRQFTSGDVLGIKIYTEVAPKNGYYRIPLGLENNPLNFNLTEFTLGQATDHISSAVEVFDKFQGSYPGTSNLRDIDGFQDRATRFLKHSGIAPMSVALLCDKDINIIKSLQYASKAYTDFKTEFIKTADSIPFNDNVSDFVDTIISTMGTTKSNLHPFADSDMIGSGAHTTLNYLVEDEGITVFALSEKFDLDQLSRRAVYVYVNDMQIIYKTDYEFDSTFGFVRIKKELFENDRIEIREYISTGFNYIPPTPTKLGLYKKYLPRKFLDDRFVTPRVVIEGHDGSIITAFEDFKDDLILELELRIYNNIKQNYDENIFDIDKVIGGYYNTGLYNKSDLDPVVSVDFLRWVSNTDLDYTDNTDFFDSQNPFTYTYSNMADPTGEINLPGYWRGVYQWFYDTDRPHTCPWEMLGFSEKPTWWEEEYGPAPYTKDNLLLWEDLRDGIIRQGLRAGRHDRYKRYTILSHIPVDGDGNLVNPLDSGLATNFTLINNKGTYNLGDISPVEYSWRSSSEWPFSVIKAICLMKPFEFITDSFDRNLLFTNQKNQTVLKETGNFIQMKDLKIPVVGETQTAGLVNFVASYIKFRNQDPESLLVKLKNLDVNLSTRISGFVDQTEQKYLLDSKNPRSTTSSVFVPPENYDIIFNTGVPFASLVYSGVIIEKTDRGWKVKGYDKQNPYFNYNESIKSTSDPLISVGGTSEQFMDWAPDNLYNNGTLIRYQDRYYRSLKTHTSEAAFDNNLWKQLPALPLVGAQQAYFRKTFDTLRSKKLAYGSILSTLQDVVDFLLGYEFYLKLQGFTFDRYDSENQVAYNWSTSCKEFMFWTKHNWAVGSLLTLSPSAQEISINLSLGVADNLFDSFYDYQIFKGDGTALLPNFINVFRDFQQAKISTVNTNDGIYFIQVNFILKEHVTIFSDRTVFNDVIYDKTTGYRQERIKSRGFRTVDWDGDYTSPGFIFDNVDIKNWEPFVDYRLGDIVAYQAYQYTSLVNQFGSDSFDDTKWARLDVIPTKALIPNFDYRINQFEDYFDLDSDGLGSSQRDLSRHVIGYQTRDYLQNLAEDSVSQFKIYQGFIREKGTANSIVKVFEKLSRTSAGSVDLHEEWAFRVGRFGGYDQFTETEFRLHRADFKINPQPILLAPVSSTTDQLDQYLRVPQQDFTIAPVPFNKEINPVRKYQLSPRTAGYVDVLTVDAVVKTRDEILTIDNTLLSENSHIWVTFDSISWTVLRFNTQRLLRVIDLTINRNVITLTINRPHGLEIGDIFGIRDIVNLQGFFKITAVTSRNITFQIAADADPPEFDPEKIINLETLTTARFNDYQSISLSSTGVLTTGSKLWIDKNQDDNWEVIEKQNVYNNTEIIDYGLEISSSSGTIANGYATIYDSSRSHVISSMPSANLVVVYGERFDGLRPFQILEPPRNITESVRNHFGESLAISPDGRWLAVGSPRANNVSTRYQGDYDISQVYNADDIVFENGLLWRAKEDIDPSITGDGSTINFGTELWDPVKIVTVDSTGNGSTYINQGTVTMYEWVGQTWVERYSFVSPDQSEGELYGSSISIAVDNGDYLMAVSAPGARVNKGRVYLYRYSSVIEDTTETVTYTVTVGPRTKPGPGSVRFYIDGVETPSLTFFVGNTYVFDQSDDSNIFYPNPTSGTVLNIHPLDFSADNINGELGGGTPIRLGVTYFIDNAAVDKEVYLSKFAISTRRRIQIEIFENSDSTIYYHSTRTQFMGSSGIKRYPDIAKEWSQFDNHRYFGKFDNTVDYPAGAIVWGQDFQTPGSGLLYEAKQDIVGGDSTESIRNQDLWLPLDPVSTSASLPSTVALLEDDGSTLDIGLLNENQLAELVKSGDGFGFSLTMNYDGSILVVGAPDSDGQYFSKYRGIYKSNQEYMAGDIVAQIDSETGKKGYWQLIDPRSDDDSATDSSVIYTSIGNDPGAEPWESIGDSTSAATGKIYVYNKNEFGFYSLAQTITAGSLQEISDLSVDERISSGDKFGFSIDLDYAGTTLVVSSPQADINLQNQGSVYVFKTNSVTDIEFRLKQKLESYETYNNELFGSSVSITPNTEQIVVGAKNSPYRQPVVFDSNSTGFDKGKTRFSDDRGYPGQVYVFELKDSVYLLAERLDANLGVNESFGSSIDTAASIIVVGSPDYKTTINGSTIKTGITRLFKKDIRKTSWNKIKEETPLIDLDLLKSIALYDDERNLKIADVDIIDNNKLKILGLAEQELKFKTPYDPATYTNGDDRVVVDQDQAWFEKNVGVLWWNTDTAKWIYYEQGDIGYRAGAWGQLAYGSSIDVYEWVDSPYSPADWARLADTVEGLSLNISGQPLYGNNVYSIKRFFDPATGLPAGNRYYFWVRNKTTVPLNVPGRRISADNVRNLIINPASEGIPLIAIIDKDKFLAYNFTSAIEGDSVLMNIEYYKGLKSPNAVHSEYQLLVEGVADSTPSMQLEEKWLDSLIGFNLAGNLVPDPSLTPKLKYGISFRPSQTIFVDRQAALKTVIDNINTTLLTRPFTNIVDFKNLNASEPIPDNRRNLYDLAVDDLVDLSQVGTVRIKRAQLTANIVNGQIDTVDIIDPGFGYKIPPTVEILGPGSGGKLRTKIDSQGRIRSVVIEQKGFKYSTVSLSVRYFSVLVRTDSSANNLWSIYSFDDERQIFFKSRVQAYDTTKYWNYVDWYSDGVGTTTRVVSEISNLYLEPTIDVEEGDIIRIKEYGSGGWALLRRTALGQGNILSNYDLVGRYNGTIQLSTDLYNVKVYDAIASYDQEVYDLQPTQELRFIFTAVKEDIFKDDLANEWNKLFFTSMRYLFSEQLYVDWAFKTSFLNAIHNVGQLEEKVTYKSDNLESFRQYIEEVKPFRTTIREYTSRYDKLENTNSAITDFDNPPLYDEREGRILPVELTSEVIEQYPWKYWLDNRGYGIVSIEISDSGADYITAPQVVIEGDGEGASARAFVSNGRVIAIRVDDQGSGYTSAPRVLLVGGNLNSPNIAKAIAVIGDSKVRTFDLSMKFDRITKDGIMSSTIYEQRFVADGFTAVFSLNYPPSRNKEKIKVYINEELLLRSEYVITFYYDRSNGNTQLRGKLTLNALPIAGTIIDVEYEKNVETLDAVSRINNLYTPSAGMLGKEINQLMTGIDFGGVQIQGTTFDVSGGWDALPWFTDNWDSVESSADYYYGIDFDIPPDSSQLYRQGAIIKSFGSLYQCKKPNIDTAGDYIFPQISTDWEEYWEEFRITLPYVPTTGQLLSIYIRRVSTQVTSRIDSLYYIEYRGVVDDSTDSFKGNWKEFEDDGITPKIYYPGDIVRYKNKDYEIIAEVTGITPPLVALIPTFVGNGTDNEIFINEYFESFSGDTVIFRPVDSDGTVKIVDVNIIDTNISGGSLSNIDQIYQTAAGTMAEDIVIEGGKFITPDHVPAPEENLPGQVLDSVSIKVFHTEKTGATPLQVKVFTGDGQTRRFDIGLTIFEPSSLMVYVDKVKYAITADSSLLEYEIDYVENQIEFTIAPIENSIIEIISIGIGGGNLLDYQEFEADGETNNFLTRADFSLTQSVLVTVDGAITETAFVDSKEVLSTQGKTLIQIPVKPPRRSIVKIICLGQFADQDIQQQSIIRVNQQSTIFDGSTRAIEIDKFVELSRGSTTPSVIVEINDRYLNGIDTIVRVYDGYNNVIGIGVDPRRPFGESLAENIKVFVNNDLKRYIIDWVYDGTSNEVTVNQAILNQEDEIRIEVDIISDYTVTDNILLIKDSVDIAENDTITVTWFSEYPSMNIVSDQYSGGKVRYILSRTPLSSRYVWVYVNGRRLSHSDDYELVVSKNSVYLKRPTQTTDTVVITVYGSNIRKKPIAYEIHKDMLNVYRFTRFGTDKKITLSKPLYYYDTEIELTDASNLFDPITERNIPGTIFINGERVNYFSIEGNTLKQLRRGANGSSIAEVHEQGSEVADLSVVESLPYNENQDRTDFISSGETTYISNGTTREFVFNDLLKVGNGNTDDVVVTINNIATTEFEITVDGAVATLSISEDISIETGDVISVKSLLIGILEYVPSRSLRDFTHNRITIPTRYGLCDQIEVFVGGRRLRKDSLAVYDESLGVDSPLADRVLEAEFSVDNEHSFVRLTEPVSAGTRVTIIRRTGSTWYDKGENAASLGKTLWENNSQILRFVTQRSTELPE